MSWVIPPHHALAIRYIAAWECMREYGRVWEKNTCRLILSGVLQAGAERLSAVFSHIFNPPRGTQVCAIPSTHPTSASIFPTKPFPAGALQEKIPKAATPA